MWLGSKTCAWLARLFGATPDEEGFKGRRMYTQSVCVWVPMPEWNYVCSCFLYVVALFWHVVVSWLANEDRTRHEVVRVGAVPPQVFLTWNTCSLTSILICIIIMGAVSMHYMWWKLNVCICTTGNVKDMSCDVYIFRKLYLIGCPITYQEMYRKTKPFIV